MVRRLGVFGSAGALLASVFVAVATLGVSPARAASFEDWAVVSAGGKHTCGVRSNGKLYCWGSDNSGKLGNGDELGDRLKPWRIGSFEDWATVSAGGDHSCGVRRNGKLYCWGSDDYGQIGNGDDDGYAVETPKRIGSFEDWATVSAGDRHTCGVRKNAKLYCWGGDGDGQVGDGGVNLEVVPAPVRIASFVGWVTVDAGDRHTCGVTTDGELGCWGNDNYGQLGNGGETSDFVLEPAQIGNFQDWVTVSAGQRHTCGVRRNGKLYCWGTDQYGQVGDGGENLIEVPAPRRIGSFEDWVGVSTGGLHTCGVRKNGKLYCWGINFYGEVGNGSDVGSEVPITAPLRIGTFEDWATVSAGETHSCGIRANHKLYCWGNDLTGQIGDGDNPDPATAPRRI